MHFSEIKNCYDRWDSILICLDYESSTLPPFSLAPDLVYYKCDIFFSNYNILDCNYLDLFSIHDIFYLPGHLLSKPSTSGERLAQEALQGE